MVGTVTVRRTARARRIAVLALAAGAVGDVPVYDLCLLGKAADVRGFGVAEAF